MPDEKSRATLTRIRGQQAAAMPHEQAKQYVRASSQMDRNYEGVETATDLTARKQQSQKVLGSYKDGGTVPKTGNYKLHKGETVIATDPQHAAQSNLRSKADILDKSGDTSGKAAQFRSRASALDAADKGMVIPDGSTGPHSQYHKQNRDGRK